MKMMLKIGDCPSSLKVAIIIVGVGVVFLVGFIPHFAFWKSTRIEVMSPQKATGTPLSEASVPTGGGLQILDKILKEKDKKGLLEFAADVKYRDSMVHALTDEEHFLFRYDLYAALLEINPSIIDDILHEVVFTPINPKNVKGNMSIDYLFASKAMAITGLGNAGKKYYEFLKNLLLDEDAASELNKFWIGDIKMDNVDNIIGIRTNAATALVRSRDEANIQVVEKLYSEMYSDLEQRITATGSVSNAIEAVYDNNPMTIQIYLGLVGSVIENEYLTNHPVGDLFNKTKKRNTKSFVISKRISITFFLEIFIK